MLSQVKQIPKALGEGGSATPRPAWDAVWPSLLSPVLERAGPGFGAALGHVIPMSCFVFSPPESK